MVKKQKCCKNTAANQSDLILLQCFCSIFCYKNRICCSVSWVGHVQDLISMRSTALFCCVWMKNAARGPWASICKIFADDKQLFWKDIFDSDTSNIGINNDLVKVHRLTSRKCCLILTLISQQQMYIFIKGVNKLWLSLILSRKQLLTIYKSFEGSHLDYANIVYDAPCNDSPKEKLEKGQYSAALIIIGTIKKASKELLYKGLSSLTDRRA